ncbi:MAG: DNRLRE domain-containing protein [Blastocatellia bacterium]|nr:DNRLRE domain-containing protein [Blastocatellia bacterium]
MISAIPSRRVLGLRGARGAALTQTTLTLQPDATAGLDTMLYAGAATTNYGTLSVIAIGEPNDAVGAARGLYKFDLSSIPSGATISSATLSLYAETDRANNAGTYRVFRQKRAWVEAQASWNVYSTGNSWGAAGGFDATDCEQTDIGSLSLTASETLNVFKDWTLTASAIQEMITGGTFTNNGFLIKTDAEADDAYNFTSSDGATAGNRPKLVIVYLS